MSHEQQHQALFNAISRLLRPLIRMLLRYGVPYAAFADLAKQEYVRVAETEFAVSGRKQTNSRVATITGLSRKEVQRVKALDGANDPIEVIERYHRAARVVSGWIQSEPFCDQKKNPLPLSLDGGNASFNALVKMFSGDMPPRAVLDELERNGMVERGADGKVHLIQRAYIPKTGEIEKLGLLGTDVAGLIATIDHNIQVGAKDPYFQRKVYYDNLSEESVAELRLLMAERSQVLLEFLNHWMAQRDRDVNPRAGGTGRKAAGIGIYYFEDAESQEKKS